MVRLKPMGSHLQFLQWFKDEAEEIEKFHVQTYLDDMEQSNKSGGTIKNIIQPLPVFQVP